MSKITGYRALSREQLALVNEIKAFGDPLAELVKKLRDYQDVTTANYGSPDAEAQRWFSIGATHLQQGLMALVRGVAKPEGF
jgi:hypothetical protein